jgi:hypothetical protein
MNFPLWQIFCLKCQTREGIGAWDDRSVGKVLAYASLRAQVQTLVPTSKAWRWVLWSDSLKLFRTLALHFLSWLNSQVGSSCVVAFLTISDDRFTPYHFSSHRKADGTRILTMYVPGSGLPDIGSACALYTQPSPWFSFTIRGHCLSRGFFLFLNKTSWPRSKLGRKGFIRLTLPHCCSSPKEVRTGTQAGQEAGADAETMEGCYLLACFLIEPKTTSPEMAPPTRGHPHWHFLMGGSFLCDNGSLCQVDTQNQPGHIVSRHVAAGSTGISRSDLEGLRTVQMGEASGGTVGQGNPDCLWLKRKVECQKRRLPSGHWRQL